MLLIAESSEKDVYSFSAALTSSTLTSDLFQINSNLIHSLSSFIKKENPFKVSDSLKNNVLLFTASLNAKQAVTDRLDEFCINI